MGHQFLKTADGEKILSASVHPFADVSSEVWELHELRIAIPQALSDHLANLHGSEGG